MYTRQAYVVAIAIALGGFLLAPASGQEFFTGDQYPRLNLLDRTDGLPHNSVSSIQQDRRGFLWFGTQGGLTRYDGRSFRTYKNRPFDTTSLPHDLVQTTYYSEADDTLWVGTYSGLARLTLGEPGFTTYQSDTNDWQTLSDNVVIAISHGPEGNLWVGTQNGLNRMTAEGDFERITTESEVVRALYLDSNNTLWIGTYAGLARWNPQTEQVEPVDFGWSSPYVMAIRETSDGELLLGTWGDESDTGGMVRVDVENRSFEPYFFADNRIYTVLAGSDGTLWAGSWGGGLFAVTSEGQRFTFSEDRDEGVASPVVYSLFEDAAGLVWIGTNGGGVHYVSPRQRNFRAYHHDPDDPASLPAGKINAIYRDRTGRLWVGLYSGGLAWYDEEAERWHVHDVDADDPYALVNDIVTVLYEDRRGRLWVGTNGGLQQYDRENDRFLTWGRDVYPDVEYSGEIVYQVAEDSEGYLWIGSYRGGLTRVEPETGETRVFKANPDDPASLSNNLVYDLLTDSRGDLWIATNDGLNRYDPQREAFTVYRHDADDRSTISSNTVRVLYEDSRDQLWVGTVSGGLNLLDRDTGRFTHLTQDDGLSDNSILSILEGAMGQLWIGTQQGITSYDSDSGAVDILDEQDGLFGSAFHSGAFQDTDGTLLFGGGHGITRIDSSLALQNTHPPEVQIVDVQVFQESVDPDRVSFNDAEITIDSSDSFISFEFVGLDYESPQSNRYRYQLDGFERDQVIAGTRNFATYTNLPAGSYELQVWAANNDGVWTGEPATLKLNVTGPWYAQWWAYGLYAAAVGVLIVGGIRWRTARVLAGKNRDLEYANRQLATANLELERLSVRDALTGLFNRRYFDSRLQEEWFRARRSKRPVSLLMIDVDYFKHFNDKYGHIVGDNVLSAAGEILQETISRKTDFVARYGGEEFIALLYDTPAEGALRIAERVRASFSERELVPDTDNVTVSIGVSSVVPGTEDEASTLVASADTALYTAKHNGKNRVERGSYSN
jgi:diguanylate cyclase (GGDEF)-like protein